MSHFLPATVWRPVDDSDAPHLLPFEVFPTLEAGLAAFPSIPAEEWCEFNSDPKTVLYRREQADREVASGSPLALAYVAAAARLYDDEGSVEVDENASVSAHSAGRGAYVQVWMWVSSDDVRSEELETARETVAQRGQINPAEPLIQRALAMLATVETEDGPFTSMEELDSYLDVEVRGALEEEAPDTEWDAAFEKGACYLDRNLVEQLENDRREYTRSVAWSVVTDGIRIALASRTSTAD